MGRRKLPPAGGNRYFQKGPTRGSIYSDTRVSMGRVY